MSGEIRKAISLYKRVEDIGEYGENVLTDVFIKEYYAEVFPLSNSKLFAMYGKVFKNPKRVIIREGIEPDVDLFIKIDNIDYTIHDHNCYGRVTTISVSESGGNNGE